MGRVLSLIQLRRAVAEVRCRGHRIVLTNGAFDLLHVGHVRYLQDAAKQGDVVVAAVNSDASVRRAKGSDRPYVAEAERAEMVAAIAGVDWVLVFDDDTVVPLIRDLKPDVHAKGTDYTVDTVPERDEVLAYGGRVAICGDPKDHSTTEVAKRLS